MNRRDFITSTMMAAGWTLLAPVLPADAAERVKPIMTKCLQDFFNKPSLETAQGLQAVTSRRFPDDFYSDQTAIP